MRAALDWGHDLLPERERAVLRRLAIFAGSFTLEAASAVAASTEIADAEVVGCVANLVAKSLTAAEVGGEAPCYRLLETTRAYALEKLADSGELEQVERRYTDYSRGHSRLRHLRAQDGNSIAVELAAALFGDPRWGAFDDCVHLLEAAAARWGPRRHSPGA